MDDAYTVKAMSPMRKAIAARVVESIRTIPHFRVVADVEVDALLEFRMKLHAANPEIKPSLNDLLIKASATALMASPDINIQWVENEIRQYHSADISVVTAVGGRLSTPIIRGAEMKSIWEISLEVAALTSRAMSNKLSMHEVFGGSFTISNLGMYGVDQFDAIINPPQCAILAIGRAKPRLLVSPEAGFRIATVMRVTLSVDHRGIDGVAAAAFLSAFRDRVEHPETLHPIGRG